NHRHDRAKRKHRIPFTLKRHEFIQPRRRFVRKADSAAKQICSYAKCVIVIVLRLGIGEEIDQAGDGGYRNLCISATSFFRFISGHEENPSSFRFLSPISSNASF